MSFYIDTAGKPADVVRHLEAEATRLGNDQFDGVVEFVCSELEALPADHPGVYVKLTGHHDDHHRNVEIEVRPITVTSPAKEE